MMNMLVLARKYNDIFYAISTEEWEKTDKHYLLMITDRLDVAAYPMQDMFDKVFTIHTSNSALGIMKESRRIKSILLPLDFSIVTASNLAMVENLYVLSQKKVKDIVLLEDGIMNYYNFRSSRRFAKLAVMAYLGINEKKIQNKIICTYLLSPDEAVYYFGEKKKLHLKGYVFAERAHLNEALRGKSIFVGQDLYRGGRMSIKEYSNIVNKIIVDNNIDFYLPHTWSEEGEEIKCEVFDVIASNATLEVYASVMNFTVYSFSSSCLYTTKLINPKIKAIAIKSSNTSVPNGLEIIYKMTDDTVTV